MPRAIDREAAARECKGGVALWIHIRSMRDQWHSGGARSAHTPLAACFGSAKGLHLFLLPLVAVVVANDEKIVRKQPGESLCVCYWNEPGIRRQQVALLQCLSLGTWAATQKKCERTAVVRRQGSTAGTRNNEDGEEIMS